MRKSEVRMNTFGSMILDDDEIAAKKPGGETAREYPTG